MWFNRNLSVPRLDADQWRCLFWFRCSAQEMIGRLWEMVSVLEDEGVFVTKVRTRRPGAIVYEDKYQVAAVPPRKRTWETRIF